MKKVSGTLIPATKQALSVAMGALNVAQALFPQGWKNGIDGSPTGDFWYQPFPRFSSGGTPVTPDSAFTVSAIWNASNVIADTLSSLPKAVFQSLEPKGKEKATKHPLYRIIHDSPNPEMDDVVFWNMMFNWQVNRGNGMAEIQRTGAGEVYAAWPIHPTRIRGYKRFRAIPGVTNGIVWYIRNKPGEEDSEIPDEDMLNLVGSLTDDGHLGKGVLDFAIESIAAAQEGMRFRAAFLGNDATPAGILSHPKTLNEKARTDLRAEWQKAYGGTHNKGKIGVLWEGMTYQQLGMNAEQAQLIEGLVWDIQEVSRWYDLTPHVLSDLSHGTFSNVEELQRYLVQKFTQRIVRAEKACNRKLLSREDQDEYFVKFNMAGLLRGDFKARQEGLQIMRRNGIINADDWADIEDMNPLPNGQGQQYIIEKNMQSLESLLDEASDNGTKFDVAAMLSLLQEAAAKSLPLETVELLIIEAFPGVTPEAIKKFMKPLENFEKPKPPAPVLPPTDDKGALQDAQAERDAARTQRDEVKAQATALEQRLVAMEADYHDLESRLKDRERTVGVQEAALLEHVAKIDSLTASMQSKESELVRLSAALANAESDVTEFARAKDRADEDRIAAIAERDDFKVRSEMFEAKIDEKQAEIDQKSAKISHFEQQLAEIPELRASLADAQHALEKSGERAKSFRAKARRALAKLSTRDGECAAYQREVDTLRDASRKQESLVSTMAAEHSFEMERLHGQISKEQGDERHFVKQNALLQARINHFEEHEEAFDVEREQWRTERADLSRASSDAQNRVAELSSQLGVLQGELDILKSARDGASSQLVVAIAERDAARSQYTETSRDFADFKRQAAESESKRATLSAETVSKLTAANKKLAIESLKELCGFESTEWKKHMRKPETFRAKVDAFYHDHRRRMNESLSLAADAQSALTGKPIAVVQFVDSWIEDSRKRLVAIDEQGFGDEFAAKVRAEVEYWDSRLTPIGELFG